MTVDSGEDFSVEVRGDFDDVEDIRTVPTPFTPACDGHPLAPSQGQGVHTSLIAGHQRFDVRVNGGGVERRHQYGAARSGS
jgi:hypothetical protein